MASNLCFLCFVFILILHCTHNTLLSRYRNPYEYFPAAEREIIQQLPQDMFDNLLDERPDLKRVLEPIRRSKLRHHVLHEAEPELPSFREAYPDDYRTGEDDDEDKEKRSYVTRRRYQTTTPHEKYNSTVHTPRSSHNSTNSTKLLPFLSGPLANKSRRFWFFGSDFEGPYKASCYSCNSGAKLLPVNPTCYRAFNSNDGRERTLARFYRIMCYYNNKPTHRIREYKWFSHKYTYDRGLKREYYGHYTGGCFKRFLDLGEIYTSRGCRGYWPTAEGSFGSHRFRRLEVLLRGKTDVCISSPHASLMPFARGISLFTRYNVCVCSEKYCNSAVIKNISLQFIVVFLLFVYFYSSYTCTLY